MSKADDDLLEEARERFKLAMDADAENRTAALDDLKFAWNYDDYQWPQEVKRLRKGRPCLTENRMPQFIRQIVNAQRSNRPSINVAPANSQAAPEVAQIIEGMIRHIEQWSKADLAYDTAFEAAVTCGVGYFRIATEYADDESFDQELCIRPVDNSFSVYDDPNYQLPDASDRKFCFVTEMVERKDFEAQYGFEPTEVEEARGDDKALWFEEDRVRVAEYWRVRIERETVKEQLAPGSTEKPREREAERKVVEQYLMTGDRIIKRGDWAGCYIPIIPVFGTVTNIEGKKLRKSLIRDAKDSQRINNYWLSTETEAVALQPKAPWIGPVGAFETDEQKWANSNAENHAYLQYDAEAGPPPQRVEPPAFPAAIRETRMAALESMKAIMGIYDASLGARTNETSGIAIQQRQEQGDNATYHFLDNMTRAIRYAGLCIIDLLPKVYDTPRVVRIISPDDQSAMLAINQVFIDPATGQTQQYQLSAGRYDVVVKSGPSFQTQRQEAAQAISDLIRAYPPIAQVAGDLLVKNMDFPDADKIAERLKPPSDPSGIPPQVQQQIQTMQQQLHEGAQAYQGLQQQLAEQKLALQHKDLEKMALQIQLRDKSGALANDQADTHAENQRFIIDSLIRLMDLQQKQTQPVIPEAQQMEPGVTNLVQ